MTNVFDVAAYILARKGRMPAMKLQKLVYYSQAWSLVWDDRPLFPERIEAWANGPVSPDLYAVHAGQYDVEHISRGNPDALDERARETVDAILSDGYGDKTSQWLSDLTHSERPWLDARGDLPAGARGNTEITKAAMAEYYGSL